MAFAGASASALSATSAPVTNISISDDGCAYLSNATTTSSSGHSELPSTSSTTGGCLRVLQRRFPRVRHCLARTSLGLHMSTAVNGLTIITALLIMGVVGTFALHQMMSPEIEALTQQRERLQDDVVVLQLQVGGTLES